MTIQILDLIVSSAGILLLGASWHFLWRPLAVAHLRQDIFDVRDLLFDLVADGNTTLRFDSPVYRGTREDLNAMIRFSHSISLFAALLCNTMVRGFRKINATRISSLREGLSEEDRRVIKIVDRKQQIALMKFLLFTSPLIWLSIAVISIFIPILVAVKTAKVAIRRIGNLISIHVPMTEVVQLFRDFFRKCKRAVFDAILLPAIRGIEWQWGFSYLNN